METGNISKEYERKSNSEIESERGTKSSQKYKTL